MSISSEMYNQPLKELNIACEMMTTYKDNPSQVACQTAFAILAINKIPVPPNFRSDPEFGNILTELLSTKPPESTIRKYSIMPEHNRFEETLNMRTMHREERKRNREERKRKSMERNKVKQEYNNMLKKKMLNGEIPQLKQKGLAFNEK